jgi:hypothetical protein
MFLKSSASDPTDRQSWPLYLKADTTTTGVCPLFTYAHASGESPRGIAFSGSVGLVVSTDPDDPNRIGYIPHSSHDDPWTLFVKVDTGFFNTASMYISGASPIIAFASGNLFIGGLFEQETATTTLYMLGVSGLFNNGPSGLHLFLEVGTLVYNTSGNLYTHGY